jgi:hypothetical protein
MMTEYARARLEIQALRDVSTMNENALTARAMNRRSIKDAEQRCSASFDAVVASAEHAVTRSSFAMFALHCCATATFEASVRTNEYRLKKYTKPYINGL